MIVLPKFTKLIKILIAVHAACWIIEVILLRTSLSGEFRHLFLIPREVVQEQYLWQLFTYMLFHDPSGIFHLLINMVVLWMFSSDLEQKWGTRRFLTFYVVTGMIGGIFVILEGLFFIDTHYIMPTLGASGAIFALTTAYALTFPQREIYLIIIPMKAKYLIHIDLGIIFLSYLSISKSGVSNAAHLGGMAAAFLIIRFPWYRYFQRFSRKKQYLRRLK